MAKSSKNYDGYGILPILLSQARLNNCRISRGIIREFNTPNSRFYSVVEDFNANEPLEKIDGIESQLNIKLFDQLNSEEKESLSNIIMEFWEALRGSGHVVLKADSENIANLRALYSKLDIAAMVCMLDVLESKESKNSEMETVISRIINRGNPLSGTSKTIYNNIANQLAKKLQIAPNTQFKELTEDEAQIKLTQYTEADQALAQELL